MIVTAGAFRIILMFICNYFEKIATKLEEKGVGRKIIEESLGMWLVPKCECKVVTLSGAWKFLKELVVAVQSLFE